MLDEFNSLLVKDKAVLANPFNDPDIDNESTMRAWENGLRQGIGLAVGKLLTQGRSAQVCVLLGAQQLNAKDLDLMPAARHGEEHAGPCVSGQREHGRQCQPVEREGCRTGCSGRRWRRAACRKAVACMSVWAGAW
ncbi:MAG: hypothetical protein ACLRL4_10810 [Bifidobacterium bifidum]